MSRPSITTPPACAVRALTRDERRGARRDGARRSRPPGRSPACGSRAATSWPSIAIRAVVQIERRALAERGDRGFVRDDRRRRGAPSRRRRGTSRRCRCGGSRGAPRRARATVPLPAPDGPSIAMISPLVTLLLSSAHTKGDSPLFHHGGCYRCRALRDRALRGGRAPDARRSPRGATTRRRVRRPGRRPARRRAHRSPDGNSSRSRPAPDDRSVARRHAARAGVSAARTIAEPRHPAGARRARRRHRRAAAGRLRARSRRHGTSRC